MLQHIGILLVEKRYTMPVKKKNKVECNHDSD